MSKLSGYGSQTKRKKERKKDVVELRLGVFYEDYCLLGSRVLEWIQGALNFLVGLFWRIVLVFNVYKLKTMMCQTGAIISGMSEESFGWRSIGEGAT